MGEEMYRMRYMVIEGMSRGTGSYDFGIYIAKSSSVGKYIQAKMQMWKVDLLILLPVTGSSGGKRNSTVVTITYAMPSYRCRQYNFS